MQPLLMLSRQARCAASLPSQQPRGRTHGATRWSFTKGLVDVTASCRQKQACAVTEGGGVWLCAGVTHYHDFSEVTSLSMLWREEGDQPVTQGSAEYQVARFHT